MKMRTAYSVLGVSLLLANTALATEIEPTWELMAANYQAPEWFRDGKIGIWMHWGIPSAIDENRPNDGSHYGRVIYGPDTRISSRITAPWRRSTTVPGTSMSWSIAGSVPARARALR